MKYYSDDITWCDNRKCTCMKCELNVKHRRSELGKYNYSVAHFEGTQYCAKMQREKERERK